MEHLNYLVEILNQHNIKGYLVGGIIRDYLLEREIKDIDVAINDKVRIIARKFADLVTGGFVVLDKKRDTYRVVTEELNYDLAPIIGDSIYEDLLGRDFTINALASDIDGIDLDKDRGLSGEIIDPTGGRSDLKEKTIRAINKETFKEDPLRLLRGVRFRAELNFTINSKTEELMQKDSQLITEVASERIKEELLKIAAADKAADNLEYLEKKSGLLSYLIPEIKMMKKIGKCKYHKEDVWTHSLYTVEQLEELLRDVFWSKQVSNDQIPLLKLAALFHDIGKLWTEEMIDGEVHFYGHHKEGAKKIVPILRQLTFSRRKIKYIKRLIRYHMRPLSLYSADNLTQKGKYRFFRAAKGVVGDVCLLAAADILATKLWNERREEIADNLDFIKELISDTEKMKKRTSKLLLTGYDVMELLNIEEGPQVGRILDKIREAQAQGKIENRTEAVEYLKKLKNKFNYTEVIHRKSD
ncbi:CCA tRNA nucleotidyltransferase [Acetohalobium arabaticum]|uniref:Polynucleotide adenylyltransferase/metal dependent phosphohydrolase n=1 Tax=Acetohalobium arabaticum (strain ATCC 49924 / DSM 5501 / Z-7288) TaxID=574087 RepID=D9QQB8_ACEAZ|nr:HD domain-containing protein [Acetohalobium arabaticum]ADL12709.1 polynucleotide adenylyltransferase/metal dependent phosphohydrolase [Acetohalobium arabaticum DSM 5501]